MMTLRKQLCSPTSLRCPGWYEATAGALVVATADGPLLGSDGSSVPLSSPSIYRAVRNSALKSMRHNCDSSRVTAMHTVVLEQCKGTH